MAAGESLDETDSERLSLALVRLNAAVEVADAQ